MEVEYLPDAGESTQTKPEYNLDNLQNADLLVHELVQGHAWVKELLTELKEFDKETFTHSIDVAILTRKVAAVHKMNSNVSGVIVSDGDVDEMVLAALVHDVGKMKIRDAKRLLSISDPTWKPSDEEYASLREHVDRGSELIKERANLYGEKELGNQVANIMRGHHEAQPNSYPRSNIPTPRQVELRKNDPLMLLKQRTVAACDQMAGIARGGEGGHSYMAARDHQEAEEKLVTRHGQRISFFDYGNIATKVITATRQLQWLPNRVIHG